MNTKALIFERKVECTYRNEQYLVRDNGAVFRKKRPGKRKRPLDDVWTLGTVYVSAGYRKICAIPVHRIVATAYHGEQPSPNHVVDHIDTNQLNNRPENLRWVTRLENILENPKTLRRIENKWGSIEGLINDPKAAEKTNPITNRTWMIEALMEAAPVEESTKESLTPKAMQRDWKTPSEFPTCPKHLSDAPLYSYLEKLKIGSVFSRNIFGESIVDKSEIDDESTCLSVICRIDSGVKNYALAKVTFENGKFIHANKGTFFTYDGAEKTHCSLIGVDWMEPDGYEGCIDDYC
jgi:hypothetical protein